MISQSIMGQFLITYKNLYLNIKFMNNLYKECFKFECIYETRVPYNIALHRGGEGVYGAPHWVLLSAGFHEIVVTQSQT